MREDVKNFIAQCINFQSTKYETKRQTSLLQPSPVPTTIWEDLSLDFITDLPSSNGNSIILVVVDHFSKATHFGGLSSHLTTFKVAQLFLALVYKHHRLPCSLVSNRDLIFVSKFWCELFKLSSIQLRMSTAYHPKIDRQMEFLNSTLEQYLHAFVHSNPSRWGKFLTLQNGLITPLFILPQDCHLIKQFMVNLVHPFPIICLGPLLLRLLTNCFQSDKLCCKLSIRSFSKLKLL